MCTIEKIIDETPTVRTLIFSDQILSKVLPGQFAMVWVPGVNEIPMSVCLLYTSPSPRDYAASRMPSSA